MNSSEIAVIALKWLTENGSNVVLILVAAIPALAIGVCGYAVHALAKTIRGKK